MLFSRQRSARERQAGSVLVELAAVLPVLLVLSLGVLEFAKALSDYRTILSQTRIAARYLSGKAPGEDHEKARCLTRNGQESSAPCVGVPLLPNLASATVTIEDATNAPATHRAQPVSTASGSGTVNLVTVRVTGYSHPLIIGSFISGVIDDRASIEFGSISTTMRQAL